jgi:uncharacterized membrane protein/sporulation protein YlmC with PRC-barrel domain
MKEIPISAPVECTDGKAGISTHVIIDPISRKITHIVVSNEEPIGARNWLISVDLVAESSHDYIHLSCTKDELAVMDPFEDLHYVEVSHEEAGYPADAYYLSPYVSPLRTDYVPVVVERIPQGELAVRRGALIEATDGYVGRLGEFLVDPESGEITHLILEEGHMWGKQEITIPLSAIDHSIENTIFLSLDKKEVSYLPTIPLRRHYGKLGKSGELELIVAVYDEPEQASISLKALKKATGDTVRSAAIVIKDKEGKTKFTETQDVDAKHGRIFGAVSGGLIGLIGGPAGVIVGALAGAVTGGIVAKHVDMGFSDEFLKRLQDLLQPGSSGLLVLVEFQHADDVAETLSENTDVVLRHTLADEIIERLNEIEAEQGVDSDGDAATG